MTELTSETREQLKAISTATLMSCLFKRGLRNQFIQDVRPLNPNAGTMVGEAFTLRYMPAREDLNPMTVFQNPDHPQRKAVELCPPGAVLVMDSRKDPRAASAGSILISRLMVRGAAGVVTDGGFRDSAEIARLAMPTFHNRPSAPTNLTLHQAIDINVPIGCGDAPVFPGDVIVGDADGVVVIPAHLAAEIAIEAVGHDRVRGFRHRGGAQGPLDHRPLPGDAGADARRLRRLAQQAERPMTDGRNYIAGEWVAAAERVGGHQPVQHRRRARAVSAGQRRRCGARDRGGAGCVPGLVAQHAAAAPRHPQADRRRAAGAQGRDRRHPVARGGQAAGRGDRRDGARGADLPVLLRRGAAADRRQAGLGAAGGRHRDHARAGGRGRDDLPWNFPIAIPAWKTAPRSGLRQLRRAQAGRAGAGDRHRPGRDHRPRRRARPACST